MRIENITEEEASTGGTVTSSREPVTYYLDPLVEEEVMTAAYTAAYLEEAKIIFDKRRIKKSITLGSRNLLEHITDIILTPLYVTPERPLSRALHLGHLLRMEALRLHGKKTYANSLYWIMRDLMGYFIIIDGSVLIMIDQQLIRMEIFESLKELSEKTKNKRMPINKIVEGLVEVYHEKLCERALNEEQKIKESENRERELVKNAYMGLAIQYILPEVPNVEYDRNTKCEKYIISEKDIKINRYIRIYYDELKRELDAISERLSKYNIALL